MKWQCFQVSTADHTSMGPPVALAEHALGWAELTARWAREASVSKRAIRARRKFYKTISKILTFLRRQAGPRSLLDRTVATNALVLSSHSRPQACARLHGGPPCTLPPPPPPPLPRPLRASPTRVRVIWFAAAWRTCARRARAAPRGPVRNREGRGRVYFLQQFLQLGPGRVGWRQWEQKCLDSRHEHTLGLDRAADVGQLLPLLRGFRLFGEQHVTLLRRLQQPTFDDNK